MRCVPTMASTWGLDSRMLASIRQSGAARSLRRLSDDGYRSAGPHRWAMPCRGAASLPGQLQRRGVRPGRHPGQELSLIDGIWFSVQEADTLEQFAISHFLTAETTVSAAADAVFHHWPAPLPRTFHPILVAGTRRTNFLAPHERAVALHQLRPRLRAVKRLKHMVKALSDDRPQMAEQHTRQRNLKPSNCVEFCILQRFAGLDFVELRNRCSCGMENSFFRPPRRGREGSQSRYSLSHPVGKWLVHCRRSGRSPECGRG